MEIDNRNTEELESDSEMDAGKRLIAETIAFETARIKKLASQARHSRFLILTVFFLLVTSLTVYIISPMASVRSISVYGNDLLSREYILESTGINDDSRFLFVIPSLNEMKGESSPLIRELKISRGPDHTVRIDVTEEDIIGYVYDDKMELVLGDGSRVEMNGRFLKNLAMLPMFIGLNEEKVTEIAGKLKDVDLDLRVRISEVHDFALSYDSNMVKFVMDDNYQVYAPIDGIGMLNQYLEIIKTTTSRFRCILMDQGNNVAILRDCAELEKMYEETRKAAENNEPTEQPTDPAPEAASEPATE